MTKGSTSASSGLINYAKRGWLWLGAALLLILADVLAGIVLNAYSDYRNSITETIVLFSAIVVTLLLSAFNFAKYSKQNKAYIVMATIEIFLSIYLVWLILLARSY